MASVTSLDKDLRKMRLDKYTPQAANEVREWIESVLGESLTKGDLLDALKDGIALCKLAAMAAPSANIKYKSSSMPFVQMENISHFLRACQSPPLNLQPHDVFLTVDLYEHKDPAQVLQCLGAFSRVANQLQPSRFSTAIGPKTKSGIMSPQGTGTGPGTPTGFGSSRARGVSNASNGSSSYGARLGAVTPTRTGESNSGRTSPTKNGGTMSPVSSWSKRQDEGITSPAWNIAQYGYMGGASQGNMGISFGGRRQITSAGPYVPSVAEKEKKRREKEAEEERQRQAMEEAEHKRRIEREAEEERARVEEEERWAEETRKMQEQERLKVEEEKRKWEEEERRWKEEEERRQQEEKEAEERMERERRTRARGTSDARLHGQFLSQYQAEHGGPGVSRGDSGHSGYSNTSAGSNSRIQELELELARERERQYERERQERMAQKGRSNKQQHQALEDHDFTLRMKEEDAIAAQQAEAAKARSRSRSRSRPRQHPRPTPQDKEDEEWRKDEREYLQKQWAKQQSHHGDGDVPPAKPPRPLPNPEYSEPAAPAKPPRPVQQQTEQQPPPPVRLVKNNTGPSSRPLPDPTSYNSPSASKSPNPSTNRTDRYLTTHPAPSTPQASTTYSSELGSTYEQDGEDRRRAASQAKTKAGGWASKSLLEREMELERQRQREWEEEQKESAKLSPSGRGVDGVGGGIDGRWDVNQWSGYTGGDGMNRGTQGIGAGRRQIVGPRPPPAGGSGGK